MDSLIFTLNVVLPVFIMIFAGKVLYILKIIDDNFITRSSNIVFTLALPALIFSEVSALNLSDIQLGGDIIMTIVYCCSVFTLALAGGMIFIKDRKKVGVFAQGVFRGNYGIIALALLNNMFGSKGLTKGAIILSIATIFYNVFATVAFIVPSHKMSLSSLKKMLLKIATNPILIGVVLAFVVLGIKSRFPSFMMPAFVSISLKYLAAMSLPVALIGIGGSISFTHIRKNKKILFIITFLRMIVSPAVFTVIAVFLGFSGPSLAGLFFLFGVPIAAASFVLARTMDGDHELAANAVALTTAVSVVTLSLGVFILNYFSLI